MNAGAKKLSGAESVIYSTYTATAPAAPATSRGNIRQPT